jgi:cytochrome c biogenesis protein CcdA
LTLEGILFNFAFAFLAGLSSLLHPCAFALLPGYIAYLVESESLTHGVFSGLVFTSGLVTVLTIFGALLSSIGGILIAFLPWIQILVGVAIIVLGVIQAVGLSLPSFSPGVRLRKGTLGLYIFGLGFGLVISGCSAPVFFSIILYSFIGGIQNGVVALAAYGLGMGLITMALSLVTLKTKQTILNRIAQHSKWIDRITGSILITAGLYIVFVALPT